MYCSSEWIHENFKNSLPWNQPTNIFTLDLIQSREELVEYIDQLEIDMDYAYATNAQNKGEIMANFKAAKLYWATAIIGDIRKQNIIATEAPSDGEAQCQTRLK